ncbi:MAG: CooT family nickel-binding protein [Bacillota bacterium]|jgi:predicted RNA-binding protein
MCLAKVFVDQNDFAQSVTNFRQNGDELTFITLFGEEKTVTGEVESIDFTESIINVTSK